jgi:hypothetical protein
MATRRGDPRNQRKYKAIRLTVLARDQYVCYYCNSPATTVDHIIPVSRSTEAEAYDPNNMVACCSRCNSKRGSRNHGVFLAQQNTPPASLFNLSPKMTETVHKGPMTGNV